MSLDISKHKTLLVQILKDIYSATDIAPHLGFKGGTAALMFYGLDRFSMDLDFDLLDESKENYVFDRIGQIIKPYGTLRESYKKRYNLFFLLSYEDKAQNIKVEVNRRQFDSAFMLKTYLGISMMVMTPEDMFAHKLTAMVERLGRTNRDIYDVWFFLQHNWTINRKIVEKRFGLNYPAILQKSITMLEKTDDHNILDGMGELPSEKQKMWVKSNLKNDTLFLLNLALENEK